MSGVGYKRNSRGESAGRDRGEADSSDFRDSQLTRSDSNPSDDAEEAVAAALGRRTAPSKQITPHVKRKLFHDSESESEDADVDARAITNLNVDEDVRPTEKLATLPAPSNQGSVVSLPPSLYTEGLPSMFSLAEGFRSIGIMIIMMM